MSAGLELYFKDPVKAQRTYCQEEKGRIGLVGGLSGRFHKKGRKNVKPQGLHHRTRRSKKPKK